MAIEMVATLKHLGEKVHEVELRWKGKGSMARELSWGQVMRCLVGFSFFV